MDELHWSAIMSLETACDRCYAVHYAHEQKSQHYEYGIGWYEYVNTDPENNINDLLDQWWETVPHATKIQWLQEALERAKERVATLQALADTYQ